MNQRSQRLHERRTQYQFFQVWVIRDRRVVVTDHDAALLVDWHMFVCDLAR